MVFFSGALCSLSVILLWSRLKSLPYSLSVILLWSRVIVTTLSSFSHSALVQNYSHCPVCFQSFHFCPDTVTTLFSFSHSALVQSYSHCPVLFQSFRFGPELQSLPCSLSVILLLSRVTVTALFSFSHSALVWSYSPCPVLFQSFRFESYCHCPVLFQSFRFCPELQSLPCSLSVSPLLSRVTVTATFSFSHSVLVQSYSHCPVLFQSFCFGPELLSLPFSLSVIPLWSRDLSAGEHHPGVVQRRAQQEYRGPCHPRSDSVSHRCW